MYYLVLFGGLAASDTLEMYPKVMLAFTIVSVIAGQLWQRP